MCKIRLDLVEDVKTIIGKLRENGYKAHLVGGCVRDSILGREPNDWDICTNATPDEMLKVFKEFKVVPLGIEHGTVVIVLNNKDYEVTTYRVDGEYTNNRKPDSVKFTDNIIDDISRRDFTINAMAYSEEDGLIDIYGGRDDLCEGLIKCVGNADERFKEDGLRILRAIRFSSQLGFKIEKKTSTAIVNNSRLVGNISRERVQEELNKLLVSGNASKGIRCLCELGVMDYIIPELVKCRRFNQRNPHHDKDVLEHILNVVDNIEPKLELRLSALFHDIGKPDTFNIGKDGIGHFYSHHKESSDICVKVMKRLRYTNIETEYVSTLVYNHMIKYESLSDRTVKRFINKVGVDKVGGLFKLLIADRLGGKKPVKVDDIYRLKSACERVLSEKQPLGIKDLDIDGRDLIKLGVPKNSLMGDILNLLLNKVLDDPGLNEKQTLIGIVKTECGL